ncbi:hypothetical protein ONA70_30380 [Micromonospora yasonensis]|uniref:hypothetical protein n=1 Tax=Micromonospora yasonensis TaxID=1128667 RepID=UPI00222E605C|nr:hypothetical protein [Micromonospora yasonensis]MCW3844403.1 hypothetical protein [Micromonospora yasonensis]
MRRARILALPFGSLAFALRLAATFWVNPLTWQMRPAGLSLLVWLAGPVVSVAIPVGLYHLAVLRAVPRRPASFQLDNGALVAPASPHDIGTAAIIVLWIAAGAVLTERVPNADQLRLAQIDFAALVSIAIVGLLSALAVALVLVDRPWVALNRDGITVQRMTSRRFIGWPELAPGGPPPPPGRRPRNLWLYRTHGPTVGGRPRPELLPVGQLQVDPAFLANTIHHYVDQPGQRPDIGTEAELDRVRTPVGGQGDDQVRGVARNIESDDRR